MPRTLSDADRGVNLNSEDGGERGAAPALDVCRDTAGHCVSSPSHARHRENCADDSGSRDMKIERCLEFLRIRHPHDLQITRPNHVWCTDVTYIPLQRGFLYLVAVMDWASRKVLSWLLSNTLDARFCVDALHEALERYGPPEIFNSDQGSQFTSVDFTDVLKEAGICISMDGKGRWMDNVFIEQLWRSLTYECVYLSEFATGSQARTGIGWWMDFYDRRRPHSSLNDRTPQEAYTDGGTTRKPADEAA